MKCTRSSANVQDDRKQTREEKVIEAYRCRIGNRQLLAIRAHCVECFGGQPQAIADCPSQSCALWPWRMGTGNPGALEWRAADPSKNELRGFWTAKTQPIASGDHDSSPLGVDE